MGPITSAIRRLAALALFGAGFIETQRDDADLKHTVRSADSLASATALLGRPVFMPWTLIPETDPAFPFRPLFAELRRNINLLRQCDDGHEGFLDCREVVRYVLDEDSEIVRASPFDDSVPLDTRGSGAQLYRLPCILVIGMRSRRQVVRAGVHGASVRNIGRQSCGACACDLSSAWRSVACDRPAAFLRCYLAQPPSMFVVLVHGVYV
jgi:hypothetical protein